MKKLSRPGPPTERTWRVGAAAHCPRVLGAWAVPDTLTPSEWAAAHRVLRAEDGVAEPGPWNNDRAPHLVAIMDACGTHGIREVVGLKAGQVGFSEALRNVVGYWIDCDPGDTLIVLPNEEMGRAAMTERIEPMVLKCDRLQRFVSGRAADMTDARMNLSTMHLFMASANSPGSMASRPCRRAVFDEVDKYPMFSGREADPLSLGEVRLITFLDRAFRAKFSTPTTRNGTIWKAWEACPTKLLYHVPCPHCHKFQVLTFDAVRWPDRKTLGLEDRQRQADEIEGRDLAYYCCPLCEQEWRERHRPASLLGGVWAPEEVTVTAAMVQAERERLAGERDRPVAEIRAANFIMRCGGESPARVAFKVPALISPWVPLSKLAALFLRSQHHPEKLMDFRNSYLAETYEQQTAAVAVSGLVARIARGVPPARLVPAWCGCLVATADTQKDHFFYLLRAWGPNFRSRMIAWGRVETLAELRQITLETAYPVDLPGFPRTTARLLGIDAGAGLADDERSDLARAHQVYHFALQNPDRVMALRGHGGRRAMSEPWRYTTTRYTPPTMGGEVLEVPYLRVNTLYWKDMLFRRASQGDSEGVLDAWELSAAADATYLQHMGSEHKVLIRRGAESVLQWLPVTAGAANHCWDMEVYQGALSDYLQAGYLPTLADTSRALVTTQARAAREPDGLTMPDGRPYLITDR